MDRPGWRRAAYSAVLLAFLALLLVTVARSSWWTALWGDHPEEPWDWVERIGWITGALGLPATILFGILTWRSGQSAVAAPLVPAQSTEERPRPEPSRILDRDEERAALAARLTADQGGVLIVRGEPGVGKTTVVRAVLEELRQRTADLRIRLHEATPDVRIGVRTLIDDMEDDAAPPAAARAGESSLARLETALEALGNRPVVIAVDCAENLVNRNNNRLVDVDLDEAFEVIATRSRHRVWIVLVTQVDPGSPEDRTWPSAEGPVVITKLPYDCFVSYLGELDRDGALGLTALPAGALATLHRRLQGNLRLAELVHAALLTDPGFGVRTLIDQLIKLPPKDVPRFLTRLLVRGLGPVQRRVLEALAAYATPVHDAAVAALLQDRGADEVGNALSVLMSRRLVRRTPHGRYFLPRSGPDWASEGVAGHDPAGEERWSDLLHRAANELTLLRNPQPRSIDDLTVHFAELGALMRAGLHRPAYELIEAIDGVLRTWNCGFLLLEQREALRSRLGDEHLEMANDNELGDLYAREGRFAAASDAYGRALDHAFSLDAVSARTKIHANMAAMYWEVNRTNDAYGQFVHALDEAERQGDVLVRMGALEGLANCHRRWGRYDEAMGCAEQALSLPKLPEFPNTGDAREFGSSRSVGLALKLSRWYAELGRSDDATRLLEAAEREEAERDDRWLLAACLDGRADLYLGQHVGWAVEAANQAVEQAVRTRDPITLLQARTTLAVAYLITDRVDHAAHEIARAARYRREGRSLLVLAIEALVARELRDLGRAEVLFARLHKDAMNRLKRDRKDPTTWDLRDFNAWDLKAFALCGLRLDSQDGLEEAMEAFCKARALTPPTPVLVGRLRFLLLRLDQCGRRPGRLQQVLDVLADAESRQADREHHRDERSS